MCVRPTGGSGGVGGVVVDRVEAKMLIFEEICFGEIRFIEADGEEWLAIEAEHVVFIGEHLVFRLGNLVQWNAA